MPTGFRRITSERWEAEVPCPHPGPCSLVISDGQTGGVIARSEGESSDGVAKFEIPSLPPSLVRITVKHGGTSTEGLCRVPALGKGAPTRKEEVVVPMSVVRKAVPGILIDDIRRRLAVGGLAVGKRTPLFAAVAEFAPRSVSCQLVAASNDSFRFVCEVEA